METFDNICFYAVSSFWGVECMKIKTKMIWIVLPLIIVPIVIISFAASLSARNGITKIATEFLRFKNDELLNYANSQWGILVENNLSDKGEFVNATKAAIESFGATLVRSDTELIFAVDEKGNVEMSTGDIKLLVGDKKKLLTLFVVLRDGKNKAKDVITTKSGSGNIFIRILEDTKHYVNRVLFGGEENYTSGDWFQINLGGVDRVGAGAYFKPFDWIILVTEQKKAFYSAVTEIYFQSLVLLGATVIVSVVLLLLFSGYLTRPINLVVETMREIISKNDLSKRVPVIYGDEIGELGHTFNIMTEELEKAYEHIKRYAYRAVVSKKREEKIRNIFQRYVPKDVIDQFFANPEKMLVGDNRELAVLFSDIRSFTSISEKLPPEEIVESLNRYFGLMVDVVVKYNGIVDKFIGDALMAFYGAPVKHSDDSLRAVRSAFDMMRVLRDFNSWQKRRGRPVFRIGIGINFGIVTVGNIGSEKKMDYTVIGDMVNLASRLQDLTKYYGESIIISESVKNRIEESYYCRFLDVVAVVGKSEGVRIYSPREKLSEEEERGLALYERGMRLYLVRNFRDAIEVFLGAKKILTDDKLCDLMIERCNYYVKNPPPSDWNGVTVMKHK